MRLGYYYHLEVAVGLGGVLVPTHAGKFIRGLAREAGSLTLFAHGGARGDEADMLLAEADGVAFVDLGPLRSFPARTFSPRRDLQNFSVEDIDALLIRGPSPLLPHLVRSAKSVPTAIYLQADYGTSVPARWMPLWRRALIEVWKRVYRRQQDRVLGQVKVIVNSPALTRTLKPRCDAELILSSTVEPDEIAVEPVPSAISGNRLTEPVRLVYVGRVVEEKGILELLVAMSQLDQVGISTQLAIVGVAPDERFKQQMDYLIERLELSERVDQLGYVPAGAPMKEVMRRCDLLVLPSYHEGFPHVLFESMSTGLPAIATSVGGIPDLLADGDQVLLIEPRSPRAITNAVARAVQDPALRSQIAVRGLEWASAWTVQRTCRELVQTLTEETS